MGEPRHQVPLIFPAKTTYPPRSSPLWRMTTPPVPHHHTLKSIRRPPTRLHTHKPLPQWSIQLPTPPSEAGTFHHVPLPHIFVNNTPPNTLSFGARRHSADSGRAEASEARRLPDVTSALDNEPPAPGLTRDSAWARSPPGDFGPKASGPSESVTA
eukprot:766835-Hanusia_phi.AAC.3